VPAVVALEGADNLTVEPGQTTTCQLSLANTGSIVEQFTMMMVGDPAPWTTADPPVVSLFPGARQTVTIIFAPPREPTTPAGPVHFGVKVIPSNQPEESVTEEGAITVGSFTDIGAELVPRITTGRLAGRQKLAIDSRGNTPIPIVLSAVDASDALKFRLAPNRVTAAPGSAAFMRIRVAPRQRFWKGPNQQKPYQVHVEPEGERPLLLDGGYTQKAVLPKWLLPALAILAAAALLWFFVLRPSVKNAAVNAAENAQKAALASQQQQTAAAQAAANQAKSQNAQTAAALAAAQRQLDALQGTPAPTTTTSTTVAKVVAAAPPATVPATTVPPPVTGPTDGRLAVVAAPGSSAVSAAPAVASGSTLQLTNIVIQNASGSAGTAHVQRVLPNNGGTQDLLVENLGTLTDQEYMFNTAIVFSHGQVLQLRVDCNGGQAACNVSMYYTGPITQPVADTTTTLP
jgi:hypothetical protein